MKTLQQCKDEVANTFYPNCRNFDELKKYAEVYPGQADIKERVQDRAAELYATQFKQKELSEPTPTDWEEVEKEFMEWMNRAGNPPPDKNIFGFFKSLCTPSKELSDEQIEAWDLSYLPHMTQSGRGLINFGAKHYREQVKQK